MDEKDKKEIIDAIDNTRPKRRSFVNPLYWVGLTLKMTGVFLCATIVGYPIGIGLIQQGRRWTHKNMESRGL